MRYFLSLGLIFLTLFIFSANSKAADVVEISHHKTIQVKNNIIPIEPIEPTSGDAKKRKFWQKKFKFNQQQNEVEPISASLYNTMAVIAILGIIPTAFFTLFAFSTSILWTLIGILGGIGFIIMIFYIIKLFHAAKGKETNFFRNGRFILGYLSSLYILTTWLLFLTGLFTIDFISGGGRRPLGSSELVVALFLSLLFSAPILIFNIIDHLRYRQYLKSLDNNPR